MDQSDNEINKRKVVEERTALGCAQLRFAEMMSLNKDPVISKATTKLDEEEVAKHNTPQDCWCIYQGKVYDITRYLDMHPGGRQHLLDYAGMDVTEEFIDVHPWVNAEYLLKSLEVGELNTDTNKDDKT